RLPPCLPVKWCHSSVNHAFAPEEGETLLAGAIERNSQTFKISIPLERAVQGAATDQPDPADNAALRRGHSVFQPLWPQIDPVLIAVHVANVHGDCFPAHDIHRPELKGHV